jgi:arylsulfatase A-like enzyme
VAAETSGVDDGVGEVMAALRRWKLDEKTLVVYAADQGWMGGQNGFWGMGDHTRPLGAHRLMMEVPLIFRHPGRIARGRTCDLMVSNYDFMSSVLHYLGLGNQTPSQSPGRDYSPALLGRPPAWNNEVFYEMENVRAICADDWKYVKRFPSGPDELHQMAKDPLERTNLVDATAQTAVRDQLAGRLEAFFKQRADPRFDLWHGGQSKAPIPADIADPAFLGRQIWKPGNKK